ncbi:hypothetical protein MKW94_017893, partial [Papaver nudicaule]|nr:hypothetical protein [Papaver nudicaule]
EGTNEIKPNVGMEFQTIDDAWEFYKIIGKETGFPVMKYASVKNKRGGARSYTFACARAGKHDFTSEKPLRPQATIKYGCTTKLVLRLDCQFGYVINQLVLEHNLELKPEYARYFYCNRDINSQVKNQIDILDLSGEVEQKI